MAASMSFSKFAPVSVAVGGGINFLLESSNTGTENLTNWVMEDIIPSQVDVWTVYFDNASSPSYDISIRTSNAPGTDVPVLTGATAPTVEVDLTFFTPPGARVLSIKVSSPLLTINTPKNMMQINGIVNTTATVGGSITNTATNTADSSTGIISKEDSFVSSIYGKINGLIGEFVWNDLNGNGIYDFNEPGINEVTVELYDETGTSLLQTTTTANRSSKAGFYFFPNVSVGKYLVKFIPPAGYALTVQNLVHNGSTPNQTTGFTNLITLAENQVDLYINAGVIEENNSEIGEFVWDDLNANGVYDPGEPGVNGVTVELYDSDGITLLATTTTANNNLNQPGYYNFANLAAGTYKVKFIPPVGYTLTNQNLGPNGSTPDPVTGFTNDITLAINQVNTTINAGILQPCLPPIINTTVYFVPLNSIYDPMLGVTAFDCQGTNITSSVIVTQNTVNTAIAGQYTVSYKVTDYRGQTTTKTITVTVYATSSYEQAISDLIESVALEQTGISHILNAEGEKIQKALELGITPEQLIEINNSVTSLTSAILTLETALSTKLETVKCDLCLPK